LVGWDSRLRARYLFSYKVTFFHPAIVWRTERVLQAGACMLYLCAEGGKVNE
jgi:hypothetical protein